MYMHKRVRARVYMCACVRACVRARVRVCTYLRRMYVYICIRVYIHKYARAHTQCVTFNYLKYLKKKFLI